MENKYLEKIASNLNKEANWFIKTLDNLSGKSVRHNESMMKYLSEAEAAGKNYADYAAKHDDLRNAMIKSRIAAGGIAAAGAAGAGYGAYKYKQKQEQEILDAYNRILYGDDNEKQAGVIGNVLGSVGRVAKSGFKGLVNMSHNAFSGQFNDLAEREIGSINSNVYKSFRNASTDSQRFDILKNNVKSTMNVNALPKNHPDRSLAAQKIKGLRTQFGDLKKNRFDARIGLGGLAAIPVGAYAVGKMNSNDQNQYDQAQYY